MLHVWALKCLRFMARKSIANIVTSLIQWSCALFIVFISNVKMPSIVLVIVTNSDCYISTRLTLTLSEILLCWECDTMMLAQIEIQIFLHFFNMPQGDHNFWTKIEYWMNPSVSRLRIIWFYSVEIDCNKTQTWYLILMYTLWGMVFFKFPISQ